MSDSTKLLLIEDDRGISETLSRVLAGEGCEVTVENRGDDGLARAKQGGFNVVITDLRLPGLGGLELIRELRAAQPRLPIILTTAFGTTDVAIEATKLGAFDYLLKPFHMPELLDLVEKAARSNRLMSEPVELGETSTTHDALVGHGKAMQDIYKEIGRVAARPVSVLIRGETGTGKELIARAIYQHGDRLNAPFIAVNCAAIPETLLESELFGHEKGAFTGASARRIGRFEQAGVGTIFLDEIGDMTVSTQVKLMRVLQERTLQRIGGQEDIPVQARLIAATNRDLETAMQEKQFREDLFYRLNVAVITLPPLRQRREDVPDLIHYFLRKHGPSLGSDAPSIQPAAIEFLQDQPWPGNVRELENVIRKVLLQAQNYTINVDHLKSALSRSPATPRGSNTSLGDYIADLLTAAKRGETTEIHSQVLDAAERELFSRAIQEAQGNQAKAARWLGVTRVTMKAKLEKFGLRPEQE